MVLSLYYFEELKLHQIAEVLGLTESRVSRTAQGHRPAARRDGTAARAGSMMPTELSALTPAALAGAAALLAFALVTLAAWLIGRRRGGRSRERGSAALAMARRGTGPPRSHGARASHAMPSGSRCAWARRRSDAGAQKSPAAAEAAAPRAAAETPAQVGRYGASGDVSVG